MAFAKVIIFFIFMKTYHASVTLKETLCKTSCSVHVILSPFIFPFLFKFNDISLDQYFSTLFPTLTHVIWLMLLSEAVSPSGSVTHPQSTPERIQEF